MTISITLVWLIPPKETTETAKERPKLVEVKAKTYYELLTMTKEILKYGQVQSIVL